MTNFTSQSTLTINRTLIGSISIVLLVSAAALWFFTGSQNAWTGACLKLGLVTAAFWLALPTISRGGNWGQVSWGGIIGFIGLALVLTGKRVDMKIVIPLMLGIAVTMMVLRPRSRPK